MSVHEKVKMLQESYPPARRGTYLSETLSAHYIIFLYNSKVHAYYKGSSDEYVVSYTVVVYAFNT
jgi:hypothetical protein